jgi:serine/threonine protein kinase
VPFEPGQHVGRYTIDRLIAQGGMAEVYRAEQELAQGITRKVALKVIRPEYSESPDFREMFLDEARTASTLSHPNIVHIYDVGEADGLVFMAMELVPGETLATVARTLRDSGKRFSDEALFAIGINCCHALEAVHALSAGQAHVNLVHRDVSPHNLLLSANGGLKLIDFGISKAATNRNLTSPGVTKGKAGYFSPEQARWASRSTGAATSSRSASRSTSSPTGRRRSTTTRPTPTETVRWCAEPGSRSSARSPGCPPACTRWWRARRS